MTSQPNPLSGLAHSRKFLILLLDTVASTLLFFVGKYGGGSADDMKFLIVSLQPIFLLLITLITSEDNAKAKANAVVQAANITAGAVTPAKDRPAGGGPGV